MNIYTINNKEFVFDRIKFNKIFIQKAKDTGISIACLESTLGEELQYSSSQIHSWRMGKSQPIESSLKDISEQLGCLVDDLISERCIYNSNLYGIEIDNERIWTIKLPKNISMSKIEEFLEKIESHLSEKLPPFNFRTKLITEHKLVTLDIYVMDNGYEYIGAIEFSSDIDEDKTDEFYELKWIGTNPIDKEDYTINTWENLSYLVASTLFNMFK